MKSTVANILIISVLTVDFNIVLSIFVARWDYQMDVIKYTASFLFLLMIPPGLMFSTLVYWIYCYFSGYSFDEYAMTEKEAEEIENMIKDWLNEKKRYR